MKKIKMVVYGEPGVGKSVFACQAPKPFFLCTDPNYEWLEDWGAKPEDHVQLQSWEEAKTWFTKSFDGYETVVVDLTEDLFKWCEFEWCQKAGISHVGDYNYGKGYDITRNEYFIEMCKLLNLDKNVILLMHGLTFTVKDRRGIEHTKFGPTTRLSDKVIDMIEGRVRYFVRAFANTEEDANGDLIVNRYLSLSPDGNTEFGITRGLNAQAPKIIPLDWATFQEVVEKYSPKPGEAFTVSAPLQTSKPVVKKEKAAPAPAPVKKAEPKPAPAEEKDLESVMEKVRKTVEEVKDPVVEKAPEPIKEEEAHKGPEEETAPQKVDNTDKIASIRAKLAALKANK